MDSILMLDGWHKARSHICTNPVASNGLRGTKRFLATKTDFILTLYIKQCDQKYILENKTKDVIRK
jgi:hypothetical protein